MPKKANKSAIFLSLLQSAALWRTVTTPSRLPSKPSKIPSRFFSTRARGRSAYGVGPRNRSLCQPPLPIFVGPLPVFRLRPLVERAACAAPVRSVGVNHAWIALSHRSPFPCVVPPSKLFTRSNKPCVKSLPDGIHSKLFKRFTRLAKFENFPAYRPFSSYDYSPFSRPVARCGVGRQSRLAPRGS
jgi:hypothetical protein